MFGYTALDCQPDYHETPGWFYSVPPYNGDTYHKLQTAAAQQRELFCFVSGTCRASSATPLSVIMAARKVTTSLYNAQCRHRSCPMFISEIKVIHIQVLQWVQLSCSRYLQLSNSNTILRHLTRSSASSTVKAFLPRPTTEAHYNLLYFYDIYCLRKLVHFGPVWSHTLHKPPVSLLKPKTCIMYHHSKILCSAHNAFMCYAWILEQTAIISLHSINLSVIKTEADVYCAVRNGSLNQTYTVSYLKG